MYDFKINLLTYDRLMELHYFVEAMFSNCLIPQIKKPTRITPTIATLIITLYSNDILGEHNQQIIAYKIPHCKTISRQNTLAYFGLKLWNIIIRKNHFEDCTSICQYI